MDTTIYFYVSHGRNQDMCDFRIRLQNERVQSSISFMMHTTIMLVGTNTTLASFSSDFSSFGRRGHEKLSN